jgi:hypothetical protein
MGTHSWGRFQTGLPDKAGFKPAPRGPTVCCVELDSVLLFFESGRNVMKDAKWILVLVALLAWMPLPAGYGEEDDKLAVLMKKKLEYSQLVLAGIALNDFDKVATGAQELTQVSKAAEFRVLKTPQYEVYSNDFRRSAESLAQAAKAKNIDAAALSYVEMTLTCVKCHKHVREVRMARLD